MEKKVRVTALVCLLCLFCAACARQVQVVGVWSTPISEVGTQDKQGTPAEMIWTFRQDGTGDKTTKGLSDGKEITMAFTWKMQEQEILLVFEDGEQRFHLSSGKNKLILSKGNRHMELLKVE